MTAKLDVDAQAETDVSTAGAVHLRHGNRVVSFASEAEARRWEVAEELIPGICERISPDDRPGGGLRVFSAGAIMARPDIPRDDFIGEGIIFRGGVSGLIGPPGSSKSRLAIVGSVSTIIGRPLGRLATCGKSLSVLILAGNENSEQRYRDDLRRLWPYLTPEQRDTVGKNLFVHVVSVVGDEIGPESMDAVERTCHAIKPDLVWMDPLGDLLLEDNSDTDMRRAIRDMVRACRRGSPDTNPAVAFIHHARTGSANLLQVAGWDRGNFGKGSKALLACCRAVVNVAPADKEGNGVLVTCGKVNDVQPFEQFAVRLAEDGFYETIEGFDLAAWQNDVAGKSTNVKVSPADVLDALQARGNEALRADLQADLIARFGVVKRTANRRISVLIENGTLKTHRDGTISPAAKAVYHAR